MRRLKEVKKIIPALKNPYDKESWETIRISERGSIYLTDGAFLLLIPEEEAKNNAYLSKDFLPTEAVRPTIESIENLLLEFTREGSFKSGLIQILDPDSLFNELTRVYSGKYSVAFKYLSLLPVIEKTFKASVQEIELFENKVKITFLEGIICWIALKELSPVIDWEEEEEE